MAGHSEKEKERQRKHRSMPNGSTTSFRTDRSSDTSERLFPSSFVSSRDADDCLRILQDMYQGPGVRQHIELLPLT